MIAIVMGVSGSGKSAVGRGIAEAMGWAFLDGDDFHPKGNVEKMANGIPLTDDDRRDWLLTLRREIEARLTSHQSLALACSALKESYRAILKQPGDPIHFVYLDGSFDLIHGRIEQRSGHFMPAALLRSQFDTLEMPTDAIMVSIDQPLDAVVADAVEKLRLASSADPRGGSRPSDGA
jgi:gluconokinase